MRYTEGVWRKVRKKMLADIDTKESVDFMPNYDESLQEPAVPAKVPKSSH